MKGILIMKKTMRVALAGLLVVPALALGVSLATGVADTSALGLTDGINAGQGDGVGQANVDMPTLIKNVVNILLFIIGGLSVIMLIWGGIRYTTSAGNQSHVTAAKNTILYAIIGLVVAILAYAIVNWVLKIGNSGGSTI